MAIISLETTQTIVDDPQCLCGLNQNELLRIIAYYTALGMGVSDVQDMVDDSACLCGLNQNQLLRIIAYYMGSGGAAGSGSMLAIIQAANQQIHPRQMPRWRLIPVTERSGAGTTLPGTEI